jgi:hypothetical protein
MVLRPRERSNSITNEGDLLAIIDESNKDVSEPSLIRSMETKKTLNTKKLTKS